MESIILKSRYTSALTISLVYLIISSLYIVFSDRIILQVLGHSVSGQVLSTVQSYKGLAFVLITSVLLFGFIQHEINAKLKYINDLASKKVKLEISETKFRALYETMAQGVTYQNPDGYITDANPAAMEILGLTLDQMQGKTSFDPDWKSIREDGTDFPGSEHPSIQALKTGKAIHNVVMGVFNTSKEEYRWIKIDAVPQFKNGETSPYQVFTTFDDITERKFAEDAVKKQSKLLAKAQEIGKIGTWEIDIKNNVLSWTKESYQIFGIDPETAMTYELFLDKIHPDDIEYVDKAWNAGLEANDYDIEHRIIVNDRVRWVREKAEISYNENNDPVKAIGLIQDITDLKSVHYELTRQAEFINTMTENQPSGIVACDAEGKLVLFNKAAKDWHSIDLMKIPQEEWANNYGLYKSDGITLLDTEDIPLVKAFKGEKVENYEITIKSKGQKPRLVSCNGASFNDAKGSNFGAVIVMNDITQKRIIENSLKKSETELRVALSEAERSEFLLNEAGRMAKIGAWEFDLATQKTRWSKQVFELHAIPVGEVPDFDYIMGCYVNGSEEILRESIEKCITERKIYELELRFLNARNEKLWVHAIGYPIINDKDEIISLRGVVQDITELKESILRLEGSEKSLKEAVVQLERREFFLNQTGGLAKVGGWDLDLETMTPYFSDETYRIYEIPPGKPPKVEDGINFYAPEARPIVQKAVAEAIEKQIPYDISVPFISARGTKKWVRTQGQVQLKNNKPIRLYGAIQDITEQKQKEIELKTSEERFRAMIEGAPDPIFIQINKCFSYLNHHAVKLFGAKTENELLGKPVLGFFHPDFHIAALERIKKLNEDKNVVHEPFEQILIQVDGTEIWVETKGEPIEYEGENGGLVFIRDITYRKKAEKELRDSKILLENINNNLPGAVIQYKLFPDGTDALIYVSEGSKEIWGVRPEEAMQNNDMIWEQIDKNHIGDVKKSIEESYQNLTPWNVEFKNNLPDGSEKWIEGIGIPEKQEDGGMVWNSLMLDITERKLAETKLKEYQKSLKNLTTEISLVEEKQRREIAENIHDHLSQSLVISRMKLNDVEKEIVNKKNKVQLRSIIGHISEALESSRKITYELSPPILYELGLIETLYWLAEKIQDEHNLKVRFKTDFEELILSEHELILLFRSIQELINNIIKHAQAKNISINVVKKEKGINIIIRDDGKGFDSAKLPIITSKSGFGLFTVKERVQNLKGQFSINSEKGKGTEVNIYVPLETTKL